MIAITADIHLHPHAGATSPKLLDIVAVLDAILERKPGAIIVAGDLFHTRPAVAPEALSDAGKWLARCRDASCPVYLLAGNHDLSDGISGDTSLMAFASAEGVTVIHEPKVVSVCGIPFGWIPYTEDPEEVRKLAKTFGRKTPNIIGHMGIADPRFRNCVPSDYEVPGHISVSDLEQPNIRHVFLGHYHRNQEITPITRYCGSPLQQNFGEANQVKGWYEFDGETATFIRNDFSPKYRIFPRDVSKEQLATVNPRDFIRIDGVASAEDAATLRKSLPPDMRVSTKRMPVKSVAPRIDGGDTHKGRLTAYVGVVNPPVGISEEEAVEYGLSLMVESTHGN